MKGNSKLEFRHLYDIHSSLRQIWRVESEAQCEINNSKLPCIIETENIEEEQKTSQATDDAVYATAAPFRGGNKDAFSSHSEHNEGLSGKLGEKWL